MHKNLISDSDSSSCSCSVSLAGDTLVFSQQSPADSLGLASASPMSGAQDVCSATDSPVVPAVTTISSTPDSQWMVHQSVVTSVSRSSCNIKHKKTPSSAQLSSSKETGRQEQPARIKGQKNQLSPAEEARRKIRRERNKIAAAKCRNRRRDLIDSLQAETDTLEEDKATLQVEIATLLKEKEKLEHILSAHKPSCKIAGDLEGELQEEALDSPHHLLSILENGKLPEATASLQDLDVQLSGISPTVAISGNSNILLCSSVEVGTLELEPSFDVKERPLEESGPGMERASSDAAPSVPDIDLSSSLGLTDWETLYKSMASNLGPFCTSTVISSPTCGSSSCLSVFGFSYSDFESLEEVCESHKAGRSDLAKDILDSPTLLAL